MATKISEGNRFISIKSKLRYLGGIAIYGRNYRELRMIRKERDQLRKLMPAPKNAITHVDLKNQTKALKEFANLQIVWILKNYGVECVLDVGANIGQYASSLREHGYEGQIVSFEPVPEYHAKLLERSAPDPRWHVIPAALGTYDGEIQMRVQGQTSSALTTSSNYGVENFKSLAKHANDELTTVKVNRLDSILGGILDSIGVDSGATRIYLKLDTQGFDLEAFRGAGTYLDSIVAMQSELAVIKIYEGMPGMADALNEYQKAGFQISGIFPVTVHKGGRVVEFDGILVKSDRFLGDK